MDASQASTLKRNSSRLDGNDKFENHYRDALPISEVQYKVSLKSKRTTGIESNKGWLNQASSFFDDEFVRRQHMDMNSREMDQNYMSHDGLPRQGQARSYDTDSFSIILAN